MLEKIMQVASIRKSINESFDDYDIYFDVMEKIKVPSDEGNYTEFLAVAVGLNKKQEEFVKSVFVDGWAEENIVFISY